jgi:esterase/lipase superfamily enzyme
MATAACAPRAEIAVVSDAPGAAPREVYFSTNRLRVDGRFGAGRSPEPSWGRITVGIPPGHAPGRVTVSRGPRPDPARDFVALEERLYRDAGAFRNDLSVALRGPDNPRREAVIFVHGYNNTFAEGIFRLAQLAHDLELPGVALAYAWPSAAAPLAYAHDRDSVLFARDGLVALLEAVRAAGARHVTLVGHSMGALLVMEALRQVAIAGPDRVRRLAQAVVLFSPDIDLDLFRLQAARLGPLPDPFVVFTSANDRVLELSARLTGQRSRLGNVAEFAALADLEITVLDVSAFRDGQPFNHMPMTSPGLLRLLARVAQVNSALDQEQAGRAGLLPGTVLTVRNLTAVVLNPGGRVSP